MKPMYKIMYKTMPLIFVLLIFLPIVLSTEEVYKDHIDSYIRTEFKTADNQVGVFNFFCDKPYWLYIYYQTEEEHQKNKEFESYKWNKCTVTDPRTVSRKYDPNDTLNLSSRRYSAGVHIDFEPDTTYYYKILTKTNYAGKVLNIKEGKIRSKSKYDASSYPDFSLLDNYLEIDYLEDLPQSRNAGFFAALRAKYQDKRKFSEHKKVIRIKFHNDATNITLIARHGVQGFWPDEYIPTGLFLTRHEFDCYFVNGENPISVTIESEEPMGDINKENNRFSKVLIVNKSREISDGSCNFNEKIYSAKMRVKHNGKEVTKKTVIKIEESASKAIKKLNLDKGFIVKSNDRGNYVLTGRKDVKILGIFKIKMPVVSEINGATGNILRIRKPWWSFLVNG